MSSCFLLQSTPPRTKAPFFSKKRKFQSQNLWWKSNINTTYLSSSAKYMVNTIFWVNHGIFSVFHHDQNLVFTIISTIGQLQTIYLPFTYHLLPINHSYQTINHIWICISNISLRQVTSNFADDPAPPPATTRPPRRRRCGDPRGCWAQPSNQRPHPWTSGLLREKNPGKLISSGND